MNLLGGKTSRLIVAALREDEREDGMRTTRCFVHVRRCHRSKFNGENFN